MNVQVNLIWCLKTKREIDFSFNWIEEIFSSFEIKHHFDIENNFNLFLENAILIVSVDNFPNNQLIKYIEEYNSREINYSILHLSDEANHQNIDFYRVSKKIIRNYYNEDYSKKFNILTIPLGYQSGVSKRSQKKDIIFNFVGQIKSDRTEMLESFKMMQPNFTFLTTKWADPNGLNIDKYSEILSKSLITLCPRGWISLDSFRINEALECDSVPVSVLEKNGRDYFKNVYDDHPFIIGENWQNAYELVKSYDLEKKVEETRSWWMNFKQNLKNKIKDFILK